MASRKRRRAEQEEPRELTRKQIRHSARERERNRKIVLFTSIAVGLALIFVIVGIVYQFVITPRSTLASVEDEKIVTRDYWKRVRLEQNELQNQLVRYTDLERQFGNQGFFASQITQIQGLLSSPFSLGVQVLDQMINETVIRQEAATRGLTVSDAEVDDALRQQIAASRQALTVPQATETAEANAAATATAAEWTPTPTLDASSAVTETEELPTPEPLPTLPILTDEGFQEGLGEFETNLKQIAGMSLAEYREIVRTNLLAEKLQEIVGEEEVAAVEEQVNARHILLSVRTPAPTPTPVPEGFPTPEPTLTPTPLPEGAPAPTPTPEPRDDAETLALAEELHQRLADGEDFAALAEEYSDDTGSAINGGDLGWFGRGVMVPAFEEAAFASNRTRSANRSLPTSVTTSSRCWRRMPSGPRKRACCSKSARRPSTTGCASVWPRPMSNVRTTSWPSCPATSKPAWFQWPRRNPDRP